MEKSVICVTCYVITNARKRASSVWNDYQTHMRVRNWWKKLYEVNVTGNLPATTLLLYRKQACWKIRKPETTRTNSKGITANQNSLLSQLILKKTSLKRQQSHKTSDRTGHKTQAKSHDAWSRSGENPSTKIYLKILETFKISQSPNNYASNSQLEHLKKMGISKSHDPLRV